MRVLILGGAKNVWSDLAAAKQLSAFDQIIAVNKIGCDYPDKLDHWVSFHIDLFNGWINQRLQHGHPPADQYWSTGFRKEGKTYQQLLVDVNHVECRQGGSSAMVAVMVALNKLNADKVVLAGVPLEPDAEHYDRPGPWKEALKHRKAWERCKPEFKDRVRSMSGWTQQLLWAPTVGWLNGDGW